jgi:hypothetical protein
LAWKDVVKQRERHGKYTNKCNLSPLQRLFMLLFQKEKLASEEKMRILVGVNRKLAKQKEILEQNISSLLKTARYSDSSIYDV